MTTEFSSSDKQLAGKLFTLCVALLPLLASYASGIPGFCAADVVLLLFTLVAFTKPNLNRNDYSSSPFFLFFGLFLIVFFNLIILLGTAPQWVSITIRTIRYFFYIFCAFFTAKKLLITELLVEYTKKVSLCASAYIFIQYLLYNLFRIILPGFLSFLPLYTTDYAVRDYSTLYEQQIFRPSSFFLEPAHFARYAVLGLVLFLWTSKKGTSGLLPALVSTGAILLSTSSQGYFLVMVVWGIWLLTQSHRSKNNTTTIFLVFVVLCLPFLLQTIYNLPFVQDTITRSLGGDIGNTNTAIGARLGGFAEFDALPFFNKIFGCGFGVIPQKGWLSSAAYWLYGSGGIVFAIYMLFLLFSIFTIPGYRKIVLICFTILFFSDDSFYSYMCVLFFSLSFLKPKSTTDGEPCQTSFLS